MKKTQPTTTADDVWIDTIVSALLMGANNPPTARHVARLLHSRDNRSKIIAELRDGWPLGSAIVNLEWTIDTPNHPGPPSAG